MILKDTDIANELKKMRSIYKQHLEEAKLSRKNIEEGMLMLDKSIDELDEAVAQ